MAWNRFPSEISIKFDSIQILIKAKATILRNLISPSNTNKLIIPNLIKLNSADNFANQKVW